MPARVVGASSEAVGSGCQVQAEANTAMMAWGRRLGTFVGWTLGSRMLGLLRDRILGATFGASQTLDAFFFAFSLPNMLRNLFGEGALSAAFVPRYVRLHQADNKPHDDLPTGPSAGDIFAGRVFGQLAFILSLLCAIGMIAAGLVMAYSDIERWRLVAWLALPQLPYLIFICLSAIAAGVLNARGRFAIPAAAPIILNICLIATTLWWQDVAVLPYAVCLTGALQLGLHVWAMFTSGAVPRPQITTDEHVRDLRKAFVPSAVAAGVYQVNALLDTALAYAFLPGAGAVVVLYFANRLLQFPMALIGHGLGTVIYPDMASAAEKGYQQSGDVLRRASHILGALLLPAAVGLWLCSEPLVRVIYQAGAFDEAAIQRTVDVARWYAVAMLPLVVGRMFIRSFHAHLDHTTPMRLALIGVAINLIANICFLSFTTLYEVGMAVATLISSLITASIAAVILQRRGTGGVLWNKAYVWPSVWSLVMGSAVWWVLQAVPGGDGFDSLMQLVSAVAVGIVVYGLAMGRQTYRLLRGS